jgi:hypothetical protein
MPEWNWYSRKGQIEAREYVPGESLEGVSVSTEDTPKGGGMIARSRTNPKDQWYINPEFFHQNYEQSR